MEINIAVTFSFQPLFDLCHGNEFSGARQLVSSLDDAKIFGEIACHRGGLGR